MINSSGIGTYLCELLKRIVEVDFFNIILLGKANFLKQYAWLDRLNVKVINFEAAIYSLEEQIEFLKLVPKQTDVFWAPHYNIPLSYHGKLLVTVHDVFHLAKPEFVNGFHKRLYAKTMFYALSCKADAIITVSHFTKNELFKYINFNEDNVYPIYNGVDRRWFSIIKEKKTIKPYFLYVGNVKPHKNLTRLLEAFNLIADKIQHNLIIVGKRDGFITADTNITKLALCLGDRVEFTGYVSDEELQQYFVNADALVYPSLYEGFGLPPLEAMACGCPVVLSDIPVLSEVCSDAALFFDPLSISDMAQKLLHIIKDKSLRENLVKRGLARAAQFTWEEAVDSTFNAIKKVSNGKFSY